MRRLELERLLLGLILLALSGLSGCVGLFRSAQNKLDVESGQYFAHLPAGDAWDSTPPPLSPPPKDRSARPDEVGAAAVILNAERSVMYTWFYASAHIFDRAYHINPITHIDVRRSLLILTQAGVRAATVEVPIPPDAHLSRFEAVTHTPDGREIRLDAPRLVTLTAHRGESAARKMVFAFPHAEPGAVVSWRYRISSRGYRALDIWRMPDHMPVRAARYVLKTQSFFSFDTQVAGVKSERVRLADRGVEYVWSVSNLPYVPREPQQAPAAVGRAEVVNVLRNIRTHEFYAHWNAVMSGFRERTKAMFSELPATWWSAKAPADRPAPASALRFVQTELTLGATPLPGDQDTLVALQRYRRANPFEQALATYMLLSHWGIICDLIYTTPAGARPILRNFARPHRSARLLLGCNKTLLDPSCIGCVGGTISPSLRGRPAVRFVEDGARFITLPSAQDPVVQRRFSVTPQARGLVAEAGEVVFDGVHAARIRAWFKQHPLPPKAQSDAARRRFLDDIEAESVQIKGLGTARGPIAFVLGNVLLSRNGWTRTEAWMAVPFDTLFFEGVFNLLHQEIRTAPIELRSGVGFDNRVELRTSTEWTSVQVPKAFALESPFGEYTFAVSKGANGPVFSERFSVNAQAVSAARWPELLNFLRAIRTHRERLITWRKAG